MDYFYTLPENIGRGSLIIDGEEFRHMTHVMRKKQGDRIRVVDGHGNAYDVILNEISKKQAKGEIQRSYKAHNEPDLSVTLGVGILKNPSKFDFLVEKVTEIGVSSIVPLLTARTIPSHAKIERWQKLALAAMKQSGRSYLPQVFPLATLGDFMKQFSAVHLKLVAHQRDAVGTDIGRLINPSVMSVALLIGPEGGFQEEEIEECRKAGFVPINFGRRRLRTETAAIVAAASVLLRK